MVLPGLTLVSDPPDPDAYTGKLTPWVVGNGTIERRIDWVFVDLDIYKGKLVAQAKEARVNAVSQPVNGFEMSSQDDRENIQGAIDYYEVLSAGAGCITWTMADGTEQQVTLDDLTSAKDGYVLRKAQAFAAYQQKKAQINAATSVEELIDLSLDL